jgi:hypothetical protein
MGHPGADHACCLGHVDPGDTCHDLLALVDIDLYRLLHCPLLTRG